MLGPDLHKRPLIIATQGIQHQYLEQEGMV